MIKKVEDHWVYFDEEVDLEARPELKEFFLQFNYDKPVACEFPQENKICFLFNDKALCEFFSQGYTVGANRDEYLTGVKKQFEELNKEQTNEHGI